MGPGFDIFGLALKPVPSASPNVSTFLELQLEELPPGFSAPFNCEIQCEGEGSKSLSNNVNEK